MKEEDIKDSSIYTVEDAMDFLQLKRAQVSKLFKMSNVEKINNRYQITGIKLKELRHRKNQSMKSYDFKDIVFTVR